MKTAFIVPPGSELAPWAAFARNEGLDGVEIMFHDPTIGDLQGGAAQREILDRHGVSTAAVGVWWIGLADAEDSGHADVILQGMDYAAELGAYCFFTGAGEPASDDPVSALAEVYDTWAERAAERRLKLAVYLGHRGSFISTADQLAEACDRIPNLGLKVDPVGVLRNLKADPYHLVYRHGAQITHFHVKDRLFLPDAELEPPPGMGELDWGQMLGLLHYHGYEGYLSDEPHGSWASPGARRKLHVQLTFGHLRQFIT
jgi:sugar phosphate isomerase/epimerase